MELTADIHDKNLVDFEVKMEDSFDNPLVESDSHSQYTAENYINLEIQGEEYDGKKPVNGKKEIQHLRRKPGSNPGARV